MLPRGRQPRRRATDVPCVLPDLCPPRGRAPAPLVRLGREAVALADHLAPLGRALRAAALGPLGQHDVVERLLDRGAIGVRRRQQLQLGGRPDGAGAAAGVAGDAFLGVGLDAGPGGVFELLELAGHEFLGRLGKLVPAVKAKFDLPKIFKGVKNVLNEVDKKLFP